MPVVGLSLSRMQKLLGGRASGRAILETLPFLGLDIESESGDDVRVEYSPNRPDYSTDYGISMGLEGLLGIRRGGVDLRIRKGSYRIRADPSVSRVRPCITGVCALGRTVDEDMIRQLISMQEDLHSGIGRRRKKSSIGIHDLGAVSFPLRYTTVRRSHEMTPLNEAGPMSIKRILSDTRTGQDYGHLLGSSGSVPVIIDSQGGTVSLPPVINASATAVTPGTRGLFVEVTGMDREDVEDALSVVAVTLQRAGFGLYQVRISGAGNSTPSLAGRRMLLDPGLVGQSLGLQLPPPAIISSLKKSRITAVRRGKRIQCMIPRYRFDILGPMDIVEEVALGYGIERILPRLLPSQTVGSAGHTARRLRMVDGMLTGLGYTEALNSSLTSTDALYGPANRPPEGAISVLDSKSREHTILRDSILPGLVRNLSANIHQAYPQRLYETGTVFAAGSPVCERVSLAAVAAHGDANYSELKSVLQSALRTGFGIAVETRASNDPLFEDGRSADVLAAGRRVGTIGQVSSAALERLRIRVPVVGFEVVLTGLIFD